MQYHIREKNTDKYLPSGHCPIKRLWHWLIVTSNSGLI